MSEAPETKYVKSGDVHIAYQVVGEGPIDVLYVPGLVTHLERMWDHPSYAHVLRRMASFARLIWFDRRGVGLSDRVTDPAILEQRADDVSAVLDAVGVTRAALVGSDEGCSLCMMFAATFPERVDTLVLIGGSARRLRSDDYPWGFSAEEADIGGQMIQDAWGTPFLLDLVAPSAADDVVTQRWWTTMSRSAASPGAAAAMFRMTIDTDLRSALPAIGAPTLVVRPAGSMIVEDGAARDLASGIAGARYVEVVGPDHLWEVTGPDGVLDEVAHFLTGARESPDPDRVLATVMFTDIVSSTERAVAIGDRAWRHLVEGHHAAVRRQLDRFRGREVDTAGDGFFATFDGPARAVRCAGAIHEAVAPLDLEVRIGLHTGECELIAGKAGGLTVNMGARVAARAGTGETLVSRAVVDLVAGSGLLFEDRGGHTLKGVPGEWQLYAVAG